MITKYVKFSIALGAIVTGMFTACVPQAEGQVRVRAPFVGVDDDRGRVRVRAPFVNVETDASGTRVRAPFTNLQTGRSDSNSFHVQPPPPGLPAVCVEFIDENAQTPVDVEESRANPSPQPLRPTPMPPPQPRPMPESVRESHERQSRATIRRPTAPADASADVRSVDPDDEAPHRETAEQSSYLVIPVAAGQPRPNIHISLRTLHAPRDETQRKQTDRTSERLNSGRTSESIRSPEPQYSTSDRRDNDRSRNEPPRGRAASYPPNEPTGDPQDQPMDSNIICLQPAWHSHVTSFFQPTGGTHIFAFVHPYTLQTVPVRVDLPSGQPRIKVSSDELEFDYGRFEVQIRLRKDGRVQVRTDH